MFVAPSLGRASRTLTHYSHRFVFTAQGRIGPIFTHILTQINRHTHTQTRPHVRLQTHALVCANAVHASKFSAQTHRRVMAANAIASENTARLTCARIVRLIVDVSDHRSRSVGRQMCVCVCVHCTDYRCVCRGLRARVSVYFKSACTNLNKQAAHGGRVSVDYTALHSRCPTSCTRKTFR